ncbi:MAG TPA: hypothetical protein VG296_31620 [Actinospica sp.]|nr:hypothetical protein [Actinospica sp.]HWG28707.1 hypothetical protein [Actinospica sp.]
MTDKSERVRRYQQAAVAEAQQIIASMGLEGPHQLSPGMLMRRIDHHAVSTFAEIFEWLEPGQLLAEPSHSWAADCEAAHPDRFGLVPILTASVR